MARAYRTRFFVDAETFRKTLDRIWHCLEEHSLANVDWDELLEECDPLLPDTDDFENPHVSAALDAGTAILSTLRCCKDGNPKHAVEAATYARDTVYMVVNSDTPETHPLMVRELEKQEADLKLSTALVMQLRYTSLPLTLALAGLPAAARCCAFPTHKIVPVNPQM